MRPTVFPGTVIGREGLHEGCLVVREDDQAVQLEIQADGRTTAIVLNRSQWSAMIGSRLPFGVLEARMLPLRVPPEDELAPSD